MRFDTLAAWLSWQESLHPHEIDLGLDRVRKVLQSIGTVQFTCPVITIAGTNGKGSSLAMLEAIYLAAGYRVGAYTSPHLLRYNERVRINGEDVSDEQLCESFEKIDLARGAVSLTYFEFGTLAALDIFAQAGLDVVLLEVGLGGRLDAVNVIDADVALITTIDLDHVAWLGNDRESIGREKAGIMRAMRPAVCGDRTPPASLSQHAGNIGAHLYQLGRDFETRDLGGQWRWCQGEKQRDALPYPSLRGRFQLDNAAAVLMVVELLSTRLPVAMAHLREGLVNATVKGRFQVVQGKVPLILDVAHNPQAARVLADNLRDWPIGGKTYAVCAVMADKDMAAIFDAMVPVVDVWCLTTIDIPRAASVEQLVQVLNSVAPDAIHERASSVVKALENVITQSQSNDRIVVFGSFYTVAAAMREGYNAGHTTHRYGRPVNGAVS